MVAPFVRPSTGRLGGVILTRTGRGKTEEAEPVADLYIAIDQGTTSSRAVAFDRAGRVRHLAQHEFAQHYPEPGWVEHDPEEIWATTLRALREVLAKASAAGDAVRAAGIANQRETAVVWERDSGRAVHNAIVWQDRRTAEVCERLAADGAEAEVTERSGLLLDPYFSATKVAWILDHVEGARARAEAGALAFGTIDSFLLWRLTGGRVHATDATNASRTSLFGLAEGDWSGELLRLFRVPEAVLPEVRDSGGDFGAVDAAVVPEAGELPGGVAAACRARRPAGGGGRAGVFRAGFGEIYLRHRVLRAAQQRR